MLFTIGSRVKLKRTGDTGTVSALLGEDLVEVRLDNGVGHIPVPHEAITYENDAPEESDYRGARYVAGKQSGKAEQEPVDLDLGYTILKPWGVQLAFDPVFRVDADPERYRVYLINDTGQALIYQLRLLLGKREIWQRVGTIEGTAYTELGELKHNELNDQPSVAIEVRPQLAAGTGTPLRHQLRIKPKQFFSRRRTAPLLNRPVHHFVLFPELTPPKTQPEKDSLAQYTQRHASKPTDLGSIDYTLNTPSPQLVADFPRELDLHLERLLSDVESVPQNQYLTIQLDHCKRYLHRAAQLGIDRVFIIHGLGEGKLKRAINQELDGMNFVREYRNDYHPKYGHGATEVVLG